MDKISSLKKLKALFDEGVISEEEFKREKRLILDDGVQDNAGGGVHENNTPSAASTHSTKNATADRQAKAIGISLAVITGLTVIGIIYFNKEDVDSLVNPAPSNSYQPTTSVATPSTSIMEAPKNIFTVVYANSYDGFLNVRSKPSDSGTILTQLYDMSYGYGSGVLVENGDSWSKVSVNGVTGWCYNKYLGRQTWYTGRGAHTIIAKNPGTPVYGDDLSGEGRYPVFARVAKGVIIADNYEEEGNYYVLVTANAALRVSKSDVYLR